MKNFKKLLFTFICLCAVSILNVNAAVFVGTNELNDGVTPIKGSSGTVTWDSTNKILTLDNFTVGYNVFDAVIDFTYESGDITILLKGTNYLYTYVKGQNGSDFGGGIITRDKSNLTIKSAPNEDGTLKIKGGQFAIKAKSIKFDNCNIEINTVGNLFNVTPTFTNLENRKVFISENTNGSNASIYNANTSNDITSYKNVAAYTAYDLTVDADENSEVSLTNSVVKAGESTDATIKAKKNYKLKSVLVNNVEKISELKDGKLTLVVTEDTKIKVITEKIEVKVDVPSIDTTKEVVVKEVTVGVKEDTAIKENFENAIKAANLEVPVENAKVEVAVANQSKEEAPAKAVESITKLVKESTEKLESKAEMKIASFFDITLNVINTANNNNVGTLTELGEKITFDVAMPEDLTKVADGFTRTYYVIRYHEGKAEILDTKVNGNILTFATDKFSTYAIAYQDVENAKPASEKVVENPKTGDNIITYVIASVIAIAGCAVSVRKLKNN